MDKLLVLVLPTLAQNVPAIVLAVVAAASLWLNVRTIAGRFKSIEATLLTLRGVPDALVRLATHDVELAHLRQEQHDQNLLARAYVTRDEVREGMSNLGNNLHSKINALDGEVRVLRDRSDRA